MPDKLPENFLFSRTIGIVSGMAFIVISFYTILGVIGKSYDSINIALYFAGVLYALTVENKLYRKDSKNLSLISAVILFIIAISLCLLIHLLLSDCSKTRYPDISLHYSLTFSYCDTLPCPLHDITGQRISPRPYSKMTLQG